MQSVAAIILVVIFALPVFVRVWKSWREIFQKKIDPLPLREPELIQQTPWLITTLTTMSVNSQGNHIAITAIEKDIASLHRLAKDNSQKLDAILRLLRQRASKAARQK